MLWSALSLVALLGGSGIVFFVFGRYNCSAGIARPTRTSGR